jgi:hypothetical protein
VGGAVLLVSTSSFAQDSAVVSTAVAASVVTYLVPGEENYAQPTVTVDRKALHLQVRYNYEERDAASLWVGYSLAGEGRLSWTFTPMFGGVFGTAAGVAPGYASSLSWRRFEVYSEGEYFANAAAPSDSFLYNWSEVSIRPIDALRMGMVTQRTRVLDDAGDLSRGPLVALTIRRVDVTAYLLDAPEAPTLALSLTWSSGPE